VLSGLRKAKKDTAFAREYGRLAWRVGAHRYPEAPIEICYLQPVRRGKAVVDEGGKVIRTYTLREFADSDVGKGDEFWTLRGVVRSDKGRRAKSGKAKPRAESQADR
jgi:hypothetical protein